MFDVLVVGAGLSGSTSARILAEAGYRILIVERRKHVGGNVYDEKNKYGITIHKYGPHIFHTNFSDVWKFLNRFTEFRYYQHRVMSYVEGRFLEFPINVSTLEKVFGKSLSVDEASELLEREVKSSRFNVPPRNFRDAVVSQVGERLYELFFKNYTIKQWGRDPEELSPDLAKRIPVRLSFDSRYFSDRYQGIPALGYTQMVKNMLKHENISIMLGADYFDVKDLFKPKLTVYTGELDRFFDYVHGKLEYRSLRFEEKTLDLEYYQPVATVNYPNDYDWTRITEFKHFLSERSSKTTLFYEYPSSEGEPFYTVPTPENASRKEKYMEEVEKLERTREYLFVGRLAEYEYYNMDAVVKRAIDKLRAWLEGSSRS